MSIWDDKTIEDGLHHALAQKADELNQTVIEELKEIVCRNFKLGRVKNYLKEHITSTPQAYVERVWGYYQQYQPYLHALQITHQPQVWEQLRLKLLKWKNRLHLKQLTLIEDIVQEASRKISQATFPYDTDFDPWAFIILRNTAHSYYEPDAPNLIGYEEDIEPLLHKADIDLKHLVKSPEEVMTEFEDVEEVRHALYNLPEKQRLFIELYYFQEKPYSEIALFLKVKINALYKLHFDALANLRKILKN